MASNVQTVLFCIHYKKILIHKAVHAGLHQWHPSITPQMREVQGPLCWWPHEIGVESCAFLRTIHIHILEAMNIHRVGQGPQPTIHHAHSWVHHCHRYTEQHQQNRNLTTDFLGQKVPRYSSRAFIPLQKVTWVLWGVPKGWGGGGYPHPFSPPKNVGVPLGLVLHPRSPDTGFPI